MTDHILGAGTAAGRWILMEASWRYAVRTHSPNEAEATFTKHRRPSANNRRAATPGVNPPGGV
jgi:hypothetical protein